MLWRQVGVSATAGLLTCVPSGVTEDPGKPQSCRASHKIVRQLTGQRARARGLYLSSALNKLLYLSDQDWVHGLVTWLVVQGLELGSVLCCGLLEILNAFFF